MLPFLALHALAAQCGDGLRPELLALLERHTGSEPCLRASIEPDDASANNDEEPVDSVASASDA
ncbi:hypothetical protein [Paraburkholderia diazotrophica]|uniref:Uncharacterized protein n=1 Tax=Paraburkholderia diazotrophica TaxID=667676 RepID=A0A1H6Y4U1_9BURK|nr:hypothetical protein [Paraburkholderia diazotrophica]SEJ34904.1 hypothetical protein SAMN05192539_1009190 [Paraburkholderia diazotrophica]